MRCNVLIFTRRSTEGFRIGSNVHVRVLAIEGGQVRIGIDAPRAVDVDRDEVAAAKARDALLGELRRPSRATVKTRRAIG